MSPDAPAPSGLDLTPLRFDVAHPNAPMKETTCSSCSGQVRREYYEVEGNVVCTECHARLAAKIPVSDRRSLARAFGFGAVASLVAAAGYAAFKMSTGYDVGLIAILVGYVIGRAVHVGGRKRGGRRYQILAVMLTYFAVSLSYLPDVRNSYKESHKATVDSIAKLRVSQRAASNEAPTTGVAKVRDNITLGSRSPGDAKVILVGLGALVLTLLALPIAAGFESIISIFLLIFALMQAWRMNRAVQVRITGPYRLAEPPGAELPST